MTFTFSLRTLAVVVFLACIGFAFIGNSIRRAQVQEAAERALESRGWTVVWRTGPYSWAPYFASRWGVDVDEAIAPGEGYRITATDMQDVSCLSNLRAIQFQESCTDSILSEVALITSLEEFDARNSPITDSGVAQLGKLPRLKSVDLSGTSITDEGLRCLENATQLESLSLRGTAVDGRGLAYVVKHENLHVVDLGETPLLEESLSLLATAHAGVVHVDHTPLTARGLREFRHMKSLSALFVRGTRISKAEHEELRQLLPAILSSWSE